MVATLRDGTIVILVSFIRDSTGRDFTTVEVLKRLVETAKVPIYGMGDIFMGNGIVGGRLVEFQNQGGKREELACGCSGAKSWTRQHRHRERERLHVRLASAQALGAQGKPAAAG